VARVRLSREPHAEPDGAGQTLGVRAAPRELRWFRLSGGACVRRQN
jgi:hypothetical protein